MTSSARRATIAMLWWYVRRCWGVSVLVAVGLAAAPWVFARLLGLGSDLSAPANVAYCLQYTVLALIGLGACVWVPLEEFERLHRPLPVSSKRLALVLMFAPAGAMLLLNLLSLAIFRWLFSAPWPMFSLSMSLGVLTLQLTAAYFSLHRFAWWKLLSWLVVVGALSVWTVRHFFPEGFRRPITLWESTPWDAVVWGAAAIIASVVGAAAYRDVRCRNTRSSRLLPWLKKQPSEMLRARRPDGPLRNPSHSLRTMVNSTFLAIGATGGVAMSLVFAAYFGLGIAGAHAGESFGELATFIPVTFITTCGCMGLLHGTWTGTEHWGVPGKKQSPAGFLLTLPFSTRQLASDLTRCLAASLTMGVLVMFAIVGVGAGIAYMAGVLPAQWTAEPPGVATVVVGAAVVGSQSVVFAWLIASFAYGLAALQRRAWILIVACIVYGGMLVFAVLQHQAPEWRPIALVIASFALVLSAMAIVIRSVKDNLINARNLLISGLAAVVLGTMCWWLPYQWQTRSLCFALAMLATSTPSFIATAVHQNRHR